MFVYCNKIMEEMEKKKKAFGNVFVTNTVCFTVLLQYNHSNVTEAV